MSKQFLLEISGFLPRKAFLLLMLEKYLTTYWDFCSLYCMPASLAVSCSSMQCRSSNLMLGNITTQQTSAGCNVTSCNYSGFVNGSIASTYALNSFLLHYFVF